MIAVGLFTRCASIATSIVMISALSIAHFPKGWSPLANGGELAVMYLVSFIMMLGYGPGKFSLDYKLFRK
jgi:putative oxidoreductase